MYGIGLPGIGLTRPFRPFPRALFAGGTAGGWWDPSDLSTLRQTITGTTAVTADGDPVGYIADKSGNGNHLVASANDTTRPTFKTSGGLSWLEFDGSNDKIEKLFTIVQTWERISAIRQITWTASDRIFSSVTVANAGLLLQQTATPQLSSYSGAFLNTTALAVGTDGIVTERHAGASSRIAINNGAYVTGNGGTTATDGLRVGASNGAATSYGNFRFYGAIMRAGTMTDAQIGDVRSFLAAKSGVSL